MLISFLLVALIACGGAAATYLVAKEKSLLWRLSAGCVIGSAVYSLVAFIMASVAGFGTVTCGVSLAITMLPLLLLRRRDIRPIFDRDFAKAKGKLEGANAAKLLRFSYYAFFFLVFWFFFDRTMITTATGIATGGSQNLGDLPYHLGAIFSFTDANNFPPENPSWAGAKFTYPFMADLMTACFVKLGSDARSALFVQNLAWAFSLLVVLENFVATVTNSRLAGKIAPALLFFSGGLGFVWFLQDMSESGKSLFDFLLNLPKDYTISEKFRWGNTMVVLFMTQRSLLLGMPVTILILSYLWRVFNTEDAQDADKKVSGNFLRQPSFFVPLAVGLLGGTLTLIHLHSLAVLFIVTAFLFAFRPSKWFTWVVFGVGTAVIALPELIWPMTGSATESAKFFSLHFGWDSRGDNVVWFWLRNAGVAIPLLIAGLFIYHSRGRAVEGEARTGNALLIFYIPFAFLFLLSNAATLAPWVWDNIKVLIYWFVGSIPFIALALVWLWEKGKALRIIALAMFVVAVAAGALDVWRTVSRQINYGVFDADAVKIADQLKQKTEPRALFLNAPTYNSAVVLTGRPSLMRYSGHVSSHGINHLPRENDVRQIYTGGGAADALLGKYNIDYVLISPEERNALKANEEFFRKYPVAAEAGQYRVYRIK